MTTGKYVPARTRRTIALLAFALAVALVVPAAASSAPRVLLVGSYLGVPGPYPSIQAALDAARPGDWVLVGPGDYHEQADRRPSRGPQPDNEPAGVVMSTPGVHLRGMDRNGVVLDGTKPGAPKCSANESDQDLGPLDSGGKPLGRNGILVWKANNTYVENLTACNFLTGTGAAGNGLWWNGGDGSGAIGLDGFWGNYLNATSTFFKDTTNAGSYGIFSSNSTNGSWDHTYASNMDDSNYYIGACQQVCNQTLENSWSQYGALGYSGTNSGGQVVVRNSEFDHNKDGFDTNSQNNSDWPSPQDGACPGGATSPITHTRSCWVVVGNYFHDNNNPNVPGAGVAAAGPVGTGISISGGRDDTVMGNRLENNGAWGIILVPYPDTETPPDNATAAGAACRGGVNSGPPANSCTYDEWGNEIAGNTFHNNGFFGNDTNGDIAEITLTPAPTNCYHDNVEHGGGTVTTSPSGLQSSKPKCDGSTAPPDPNPSFTNQVLCDSQFAASAAPGGAGSPCPPGASYPRATNIVMPPLPTASLSSMPDPCAGAPANPWCATGLGLPSPRPRGRCVGRKRLVIRLRRRDLRSAQVFVNGRRVRSLRGRRLRAPIVLRNLPAGKDVIRVLAIRRNGTRLLSVRTYHTCAAKKKPRKRPAKRPPIGR
jgi:hypothetical protein